VEDGGCEDSRRIHNITEKNAERDQMWGPITTKCTSYHYMTRVCVTVCVVDRSRVRRGLGFQLND